MAVDMFLSLKGIKGESKDQSHKEWIDVLAWSWGMSQGGTFHRGGGGGAGKVDVQDLSLTGWYEKSTPLLMDKCATGGHIPEGELVVRKAGGKQEKYIRYKFTDIMVTAVSTGGSGGEEQLTVNIVLNFAKISTEYYEQKPDGSVGPAIPFGYDMRENVKV